MKNVRALLIVGCLAFTVSIAFSQQAGRGNRFATPDPAQAADKLVYADFENVQNGRPVSNHGGYIQLLAYSERPTLPSHFKGAGTTDAPELVHLKKDDPNRAMTFEYDMQATNQYAGVGVQIHGEPDKDGKPVADDVSAYKFLTFQLYVTGVTSMSAEFISKGQGMDINGGYPSMTFRVTPGFNVYKIPLNSLNQASWAEKKLNTKDVLKKLTSVQIGVSCNDCQTTIKGTVVIDNLVFQNL